jgi:hypothetical protein
MLVGTSYLGLYFLPILALPDLAISKVMIDSSGCRGIISGAYNVLPPAVSTLENVLHCERLVFVVLFITMAPPIRFRTAISSVLFSSILLLARQKQTVKSLHIIEIPSKSR